MESLLAVVKPNAQDLEYFGCFGRGARLSGGSAVFRFVASLLPVLSRRKALIFFIFYGVATWHGKQNSRFLGKQHHFLQHKH